MAEANIPAEMIYSIFKGFQASQDFIDKNKLEFIIVRDFIVKLAANTLITGCEITAQEQNITFEEAVRTTVNNIVDYLIAHREGHTTFITEG